MIEFSVNNFNNAIKWCEKNISTKQFWLHTSVGGAGWRIRLDRHAPTPHNIILVIDDEKKALLAMLSLSE